MSYTLMPDGLTVRQDPTAIYFVPDPSSTLPIQAAYRAWVAAGNSPTPLQVGAPAPGNGMMAQLLALTAIVQTQAQAIAALQGKPDPCVPLAASLPVATLQAGTMDVSLSVPGLLRGDAIAVEVMADLPGGLALGAIRPDPTRDGVLIVQATATLSLAGASPIPLRVTALR